MNPESAFDRLPPSVRTLKEQGRNGGTNMDAAKRRQVAKDISVALVEHAAHAPELLADSQFLSGTVLAEGISMAWPKLPEPAQDAAFRWAAALPADKRATVSIRLGSLLLAGDEPGRARAADLLLLAPDSKDSNSRLAGEIGRAHV